MKAATFYLVCCNDAIMFVVANNEQRAEEKLKELRDEDFGRKKLCSQGEYYDIACYWHIHECSGEIYGESNEELPQVV